ncbi:MAG: hypothetical protein V1678_04205 [Candidatus Aenigmatarchaeota archaeon]
MRYTFQPQYDLQKAAEEHDRKLVKSLTIPLASLQRHVANRSVNGVGEPFELLKDSLSNVEYYVMPSGIDVYDPSVPGGKLAGMTSLEFTKYLDRDVNKAKKIAQKLGISLG